MNGLNEMYGEIDYFNRMFRAKTYADAVEEFYSKYNGIFAALNDRVEREADNVREKYYKEDDSGTEYGRAVKDVKSIIKRKRRDDSDGMEKPDLPRLSDEMDGIVNSVVTDFLDDTLNIFKERGKLPRGSHLMDINIYMAMYVLPGIIATEREFAYYIAERIGGRWNEVFGGNKLGCASYDVIDSGFRRKLCYITTAVCSSLGMDDECEELNLLRSFRDGYMMFVPGGENMVREYYETAPAIVNAINVLPESGRIYRELYDVYILPCIDMIKNGRFEECMNHYRKMVESFGRMGA